MKWALLFILVVSITIPKTYADAPELQTQVNGQDVTRVADGIDIYPSTPTADGENHYIHISKSTRDASRYVFKYCRNGLPTDLAKEGVFPSTRDCYYTIGNAAGYTVGEIEAEVDLMRLQAASQNRSQGWSLVASSAVSGIVILVGINLVEAATTGGLANIRTDAGALVSPGMFGSILKKYFGGAVIKKAFLNGSKMVISTVLGTFIGQLAGAHVSQANTFQTNDSPFSSPAEMTYAAAEMSKLLKSGNVVIINSNMEAFELDLGQILAKIQ